MQKLIILIVLFLCAPSITAQTLQVSIGQDIRMAYEGPYYNKANDIGPTWNIEGRILLELEKWRLWTAYEVHQEINYTKWTFLALDYSIKNFPIRNTTVYGGVEISEILRTEVKDYHPSRDHSNFLLGINGEIKYRPNKSAVGISISASIFQAEMSLRQYKEYRTEVFFNVIIDIFELNRE